MPTFSRVDLVVWSLAIVLTSPVIAPALGDEPKPDGNQRVRVQVRQAASDASKQEKSKSGSPSDAKPKPVETKARVIRVPGKALATPHIQDSKVRVLRLSKDSPKEVRIFIAPAEGSKLPKTIRVSPETRDGIIIVIEENTEKVDKKKEKVQKADTKQEGSESQDEASTKNERHQERRMHIHRETKTRDGRSETRVELRMVGPDGKVRKFHIEGADTAVERRILRAPGQAQWKQLEEAIRFLSLLQPGSGLTLEVEVHSKDEDGKKAEADNEVVEEPSVSEETRRQLQKRREQAVEAARRMMKERLEQVEKLRGAKQEAEMKQMRQQVEAARRQAEALRKVIREQAQAVQRARQEAMERAMKAMRGRTGNARELEERLDKIEKQLKELRELMEEVLEEVEELEEDKDDTP